MIGYESYQDSRLIPPSYWEDEPMDIDTIRNELIEKYRAQAVLELDALLAAGELDEYSAEDEAFFALEIAAEYGETPEKILRRYQRDCTESRNEWLAGW